MIPNVIPSLYRRRHRLLKSGLHRQNRKLKESDSQCPCAPNSRHCTCPEHHLTPQKCHQWGIFSSALWEQPWEGIINSGTAIRKPGSWPGREMWLAPMRWCSFQKYWGVLWNHIERPSPEVLNTHPSLRSTVRLQVRRGTWSLEKLGSQWARAS